MIDCYFDHCDRPGTQWVMANDEPGIIHCLCEKHAQDFVDLGLVDLIAEDEAQAILDAEEKKWADQGIDHRCSMEDCSDLGTVWIVWEVDEDDDDEIVGCLCEKHATIVIQRQHAILLEGESDA